MSNINQLRSRMASVGNIHKIAKSMKMVAASKLVRARRVAEIARPIGISAKYFYEVAQVRHPKENQQKVLIAVTSDRGLCGGVHASVCRSVMNQLYFDLPSMKVVAIGDKARNILFRWGVYQMMLSVSGFGRKPTTFTDACKIIDAILGSGFKFTSGRIVYNVYINILKYKTTNFAIYSVDAVMNTPKLLLYEEVDNDLLVNYVHYSLACFLYYTLKENICCEHAARVNAMRLASKNAEAMRNKIAVTYNRSRQSNITRDLLDIISGASASERTL